MARSKPQILKDVPIVIYCAWSFKPGAVVALKFPNEEARHEFQNIFLELAKLKKVDFSKTITTFSDAEHKPILYINPAPKEASEKGTRQPGTYIAKNGELAIDFVSPELRDSFIKLTHIDCGRSLKEFASKNAFAPPKEDTHGNAIYFNKEKLPPQYDSTHRYNISAMVDLHP